MGKPPPHAFKTGHDKAGPGRPKIPPEIRMASKLTRRKLEAAMNRLLFKEKRELEDIIDSDFTTALDCALARILLLTARDGDQKRLDFFFDRLVGKVKEVKQIEMPKPAIIHKRDGERILLGSGDVEKYVNKVVQGEVLEDE